jgi:hypothetical protein
MSKHGSHKSKANLDLIRRSKQFEFIRHDAQIYEVSKCERMQHNTSLYTGQKDKKDNTSTLQRYWLSR